MKTKKIIKILIAIILFSHINSFAKDKEGKSGGNIIKINNKNTNYKKIKRIKKIHKATALGKENTISEMGTDRKESISGASVSVETIKTYAQKDSFFEKNYKTIIVASSILGAYGLSVYTIYYCKNYLENPNLWSNWKSDVRIEKLMEIPQDKFAFEIFEEIKCKYDSKDNFVLSLTKFMQDLDKEKNNLILFDKIYTFLEKYYLLKLFTACPVCPIDTKCFENINEKIERITYIKNIFLSSSSINYTDKIYSSKIYASKKKF